MNEDKAREVAVEYIATHQHDYDQVYSTPDCKTLLLDQEFVAVQVWVAIPRKALEENHV